MLKIVFNCKGLIFYIDSMDDLDMRCIIYDHIFLGFCLNEIRTQNQNFHM